MNLYNEYEVLPERPSNYNLEEEGLILEGFCKWMKEEYSLEIYRNSKHRQAVREMIFSFLSAKKGEVTVVTANMGLGKSSLIFFFLKYMNLKYNYTDWKSDLSKRKSFGAIVVKERLNDLRELDKNLGEVDEIYGEQEICYTLQSCNEEICKKGYLQEDIKPLMWHDCDKQTCEVILGRHKQKQHPVVGISHKRLELYLRNQGSIEELQKWETEIGNWKRTREYLIIDEKPNFFETYNIKKQTIDRFFADLTTLVNKFKIEIPVRELERKVFSLFTDIDVNKAKLVEDQEAISWLNEVEKYWFKNCQEENMDSLKMIKALFSNYVFNARSNLVVGVTNKFELENFKTIIFDGTASGDMTYPSSSKFIEIEDFRNYENLTINNCKDKNLSKTFHRDNGLKTLEKKIEMLGIEISKIAKKGMTLVVCFKEHEEKYKKILQGIPNIKINHFNNLKGSNDYMDCVNLFFAGTIDFGDCYYLLKALAIDEKRVLEFKPDKNIIEKYNLDMDEDNTFIAVNRYKRHYFLSDFLNEVKRNDKEKYILQDIFRIAIRDRNNKQNVNVYMFNTDVELIKQIVESLPGCKLNDWYPETIRRGDAPVESKVYDYLEKNLIKSGDEVLKCDLKDDLEISDDSSKEIFKRNIFEKWLVEHYIEKQNKKFVKL